MPVSHRGGPISLPSNPSMESGSTSVPDVHSGLRRVKLTQRVTGLHDLQLLVNATEKVRFKAPKHRK